MNAPIFSPICLSGVPCPTQYTFANSGCPCSDPCASPGQRPPSYRLRLALLPETQNPLSRETRSTNFAHILSHLFRLQAAPRCFWIIEGLCDLDSSAHAFLRATLSAFGSRRQRVQWAHGLFHSFLSNSCGLFDFDQITGDGRPRHFSARRWRAGRLLDQGGQTTLPRPFPLTLLTQGRLGVCERCRLYPRVRFLGSDSKLFFEYQLPDAVCFINCTNEIGYNAIFMFPPGRGWGRRYATDRLAC